MQYTPQQAVNVYLSITPKWYSQQATTGEGMIMKGYYNHLVLLFPVLYGKCLRHFLI